MCISPFGIVPHDRLRSLSVFLNLFFSLFFRLDDFCWSLFKFTVSSVISNMLLSPWPVHFSFQILYFLVLSFPFTFIIIFSFCLIFLICLLMMSQFFFTFFNRKLRYLIYILLNEKVAEDIHCSVFCLKREVCERLYTDTFMWTQKSVLLFTITSDYRDGNRIGESGARISGNFSFCLALFLNYNGIDNFKELCVCVNFWNTFVNFINVSCTKKYVFFFYVRNFLFLFY